MSLHDSILVGYDVDGVGRRIVFHTEYRGGGGSGPVDERKDVVFESVEAYSFKNACLESIIFDIEERPLEAEIERNRAELDQASRAGAIGFWHADAARTKDAALANVASVARWSPQLCSRARCPGRRRLLFPFGHPTRRWRT